jgi:hypothetical protein
MGIKKKIFAYSEDESNAEALYVRSWKSWKNAY